ncbi:MAG TPA: tetratricopeptide repeat protein [Caldilineae bacterium]|nr:tetratricopeptide repeat protein [Caldilineae bacterium]
MKPSRLQKICDAVMEATWLAAIVTIPLFFNVYSQRVFEPDKISILRSLALIAIIAWVVKQVEGLRLRRGESEEVEPEKNRMAWWRRPMVLPVLALAGVYLLSTFLSATPRQSFWGSYQRLQGTFTMLSYMTFFFVALDSLRTEAQWRRLQYAVILTSLPIALYGIMQKAQLDPLPWGGDTFERVTANMGNAIFLPAYLILVVPLTIERLVVATRRMLSDLGSSTDALSAGALLFVLVVQLLAILFTQSRGPWLGLAAGLYVFVVFVLTSLRQMAEDQSSLRLGEVGLGIGMGLAGVGIIVLGLLSLLILPGLWGEMMVLVSVLAALAFYLAPLITRRGWRWLWLSAITQGIIGIVLLVAVNVPNTTLHDTFIKLPYIGRLAQITELDQGTGRVRVLIWQGVIEMLESDEPLRYPDGQADTLDAIRPLVGYGPESMWVTFNRFYKPELGGLEKRNASPDRSHNETFDSLVITGALGFAVYTFVFASLIYYALKWLGFIYKRRDIWIFAIMLLVGAMAGVLIPWAFGVLHLAGVGLPFGVVLGILAYVTYAAARGADKVRKLDRRQMLIVALLATIIAHYIEIHSGISVVATRTYFFIFAAALVVIGNGDLRFAAAPKSTTEAIPARTSKKGKRRQRRTSRIQAPASTAPVLPLWRQLLPYALLISTIFLVLGWNFVSNQGGESSATTVFWRSWFTYLRNGTPHTGPSAILLVIFTGVVGVILALGETWQPRHRPNGVALGVVTLIVPPLVTWLAFGLFQAQQILPQSESTPLEARADHVANTITLFFVWLALYLALLAASLAWNDLRPARKWSYQPLLAPAAGILLLVVALFVIIGVNLNLVRADIYFKLGQGSDAQRDWRSSLVFYNRASKLAPQEDHYLLFKGRAYLEAARAAQDINQQTALLDQAETVLLNARALNPLNTDHSANLGRYYGTLANTLTDPAKQADALRLANESYQQATTLSPNAAHLQNEWAMVLFRLGEIDKARERLAHSLELDPDYADTYLRLGQIEVQQQNWLAALDAFDRAAALRPNDPSIQSQRGQILGQLGRWDEAIDANLAVLALRPNDPSALQNLAILYRQLGQYQLALEYARQARSLLPEDQRAALDAFIQQVQQALSGS